MALAQTDLPYDRGVQRLLEGLNDPQRAAVTAGDGPVLVLAGAGSGKTSVLTRRIAFLLATDRARTHEICAMTFTNKAGGEMRTRVANLLGEEPAGMWIGTFHAWGRRVLGNPQFRELAGLRAGFSIYSTSAQMEVVRRATEACGIDLRSSRLDAKFYARQISDAKNRMETPSDIAKRAGADVDAQLLAQVYDAYDSILHGGCNAVDFDDLIKLPTELMRSHPEVSGYYQNRYKYVLVDEYQDTNGANYEMVKHIVAARRNLMVVGDDDQCLVGSSLVAMADGSERRIADIQTGDLVASNFGSGDIRPATVLRVHRTTRRGPGVVITTAGGRSLTSTSEHTHFAGWSPQAPGEPARGNLAISLCAGGRGGTPMHRLSIVGNDDAGRAALTAAGFSVRPVRAGSNSWRHETVVKDFASAMKSAHAIKVALGDVNVQLDARLGLAVAGQHNRALPFLPAGSVQPGMVMFDGDGVYDVVASVQRIELDEDVYDIDVEGTHNFVANGITTHNSIYGFRGADVRNILSFRSDYPEMEQVTLDQNYRSHQTILDAAHGVIANNTMRMDKKLWSARADRTPLQLFSAENGTHEALIVCAEIERLLRDPSAVHKSGEKAGQRYTYDDMAVLYRTNAQSQAFEKALLDRHVPYTVVGGQRFYDREIVMDAMSYVRLLINPYDISAFTRAVKVSRSGIGDVTVTKVVAEAARTGTSVLAAAQSPAVLASVTAKTRAGLQQLSVLIADFTERSGRQAPHIVLRDLFDESGLRASLNDGDPRSLEKIEHLGQLVGHASDYEMLPYPDGLDAFVANTALEDAVDKDGKADSSGVTLITVHKSKGLEYPVCFLTGMEEDTFPHSRSLPPHADETGLEEERRLAYVAITRARDRLYLSHALERMGYDARPVAPQRSRFVDEIPVDTMVHSPVRPLASMSAGGRAMPTQWARRRGVARPAGLQW